MPVFTAHPTGYDSVNSVYLTIPSSYPLSNSLGPELEAPGLTRIDLIQGDNAETYFYYTFDFSGLPSGININMVTCCTKASTSTTTSNATEATAYMTVGTTLKGEKVNLTGTSISFTFDTGDWTEAELRNAKLCLYAKRNTTDTTVNKFFRCYGATIKVYYNYTHSISVNPSGYDATNSVYKSIHSSYPLTNAYTPFTSTSACYIYDVLGDNAETTFYFTFDLSQLPDNAIIEEVVCQSKAYSSATSGLPTREISMTTGTTVKSDVVTMMNSSNMQVFYPGTWTVAELKQAAIKLYIQRNTTSSSTDRTTRFYGATLTVFYSLPGGNILWKKQNGQWYQVTSGYSKASNTWTAASTPASLVDSSTNYAQKYLLPSGYTLLSYVQSTGAQYVDTGIVPDANTKVEAEFALTQVDTTNRVMFGVLGQFTFRKYTTPAFRTNGNDYVNFTTIPADTAWHYVSKIPTSCTLVSEDGTTETKTNTVGTCTLTMSIFGYHSAASTYEQYAFMKLYYLKVYSSNTLVRYFIPCKNASNVVGLYDIVNNVFYSSGTTTELLPGDVLIKVP